MAIEDKIIQIIPADGWWAVFEGGAAVRLVCWGLNAWSYEEDHDSTSVVGLAVNGDGCVSEVDDPQLPAGEGFLRYEYRSDVGD